MDKKQLRNLVNRVLIAMDLHRPEVEELILGTIAQESVGATFIKQIKGPALGICQMEPATFRDICENYLKYKPDLAKKIMSVAGANALRSEYLEYNLALAIAMCRIHYLRQPEKIPLTLDGWAKYWKDHYNTHLGKGTTSEFIANYKKHV